MQVKDLEAYLLTAWINPSSAKMVNLMKIEGSHDESYLAYADVNPPFYYHDHSALLQTGLT